MRVINLIVFLHVVLTQAQPIEAGMDDKRPIQGVRIAWDFNSIQKLAPRNGRVLPYAGYPRIKRFGDGRVVCVYEAMGNGELIESLDDGKTWSEPVTIFKGFYATNEQNDTARLHISNVEIIELRNGHWIA